MSLYILFEKGVLENFRKIIEYYEAISPTLSDKFRQRFWERIISIKENPTQYQVRYKGIRIAFTDLFPYGIHYKVQKESIRILKILHTKRLF